MLMPFRCIFSLRSVKSSKFEVGVEILGRWGVGVGGLQVEEKSGMRSFNKVFEAFLLSLKNIIRSCLFFVKFDSVSGDREAIKYRLRYSGRRRWVR